VVPVATVPDVLAVARPRLLVPGVGGAPAVGVLLVLHQNSDLQVNSGA
jgi:hypothetical protein